ncbi:PaaX family transcriptional regulator C-terminal domain-containing protein [Nocardia sp. 004]|uniref:PaaX family transcriptional regulator C-terminal domain-containing protein n=1 Tax=Nocardia sp. 004 TaxID=3385978 RepID=UPI0039A332D5
MGSDGNRRMKADAASTEDAGVPELRRLSARSVILSLMLGAHPPELPVAEIIALAEKFGVQPAAARVALSRMVTAGDLHRTNGTYRLADRLFTRQQRQDRILSTTAAVPWNQRWRTVVVVSSGDSARARADFRATMLGQRFAELREGVWIRPDNLEFVRPAAATPRIETLSAVPDEDPKTLAARLFGLDEWAKTGTALIEKMNSADTPIDRVTVTAAIVRHLLTDPLMPAELLDEHWPGELLRTLCLAYRGVAYQVELSATARS